jgi:outer membrane murein-binding lipoprotein Lpp
MKNKIHILICAVFCSVCLLAGCAQEDLLSKMKKIVPIFEGARVLESKMPTEKMSVIMMEVEASKASQKEILDFYKDAMTKQGWEVKSLKDYGEDGSVMELAKENLGTLSVVTITKKTGKTGKIPVTLNLTIK